MTEPTVGKIDDTVVILLCPDTSLSESFILVRKLIEEGIEVVAATPDAMALFVDATKEVDRGDA